MNKSQGVISDVVAVASRRMVCNAGIRWELCLAIALNVSPLLSQPPTFLSKTTHSPNHEGLDQLCYFYSLCPECVCSAERYYYQFLVRFCGSASLVLPRLNCCHTTSRTDVTECRPSLISWTGGTRKLFCPECSGTSKVTLPLFQLLTIWWVASPSHCTVSLLF